MSTLASRQQAKSSRSLLPKEWDGGRRAVMGPLVGFFNSYQKSYVEGSPEYNKYLLVKHFVQYCINYP